MASDKDAESSHSTKPDPAMGYRVAVVPLAVYVGAALKNSATVLTELAPWVYLGLTVVFLGVAQWVQRRQQKAWSWTIALPVGFAIALTAWLLSMGVVNLFAPWEASTT
jgi:hypothetical protein